MKALTSNQWSLQLKARLRGSALMAGRLATGAVNMRTSIDSKRFRRTAVLALCAAVNGCGDTPPASCGQGATAAKEAVINGCTDNGDGFGSAWEQRTANSDPLAHSCALPRSGIDPYTNAPYPDQQGTLDDEKSWLSTYMDEVYLWYDEIPEINPAPYTASAFGSVMGAMDAYFEALKTRQTTDSGKFKDQFSFTYPTASWNDLSQGGESVGYGAQIALLATHPPREAVVVYTFADTPAADVGMQRGAQILAIDGEDVEYGEDIETLNAGLSPSVAGERHVFTIRDAGSSSARNVTLVADIVTTTPVPEVSYVETPSGRVGYLLFTDHIATAEGALYRAIGELAQDGISDLVLDLRYNGGGYLAIASELAYMIAGPVRTAAKVFERLQFNDKNPLADDPSAVTPFYDTTLDFDPSVAADSPLPSLELDRLYVLTGPGTCSASEAVVNGLRGVDIEVVLIGDTTCGKPYGFYAQDNCGLSYFAIEFSGVNDQGTGNYADGMSPTCPAADDLYHALGNPDEALFAAALAHRQTGSCGGVQQKAVGLPKMQLLRPPVRENAYGMLPK